MAKEKHLKLVIKIITYTPTEFFNCLHCEVAWRSAGINNMEKSREEALDSSMPRDVMDGYKALSDWVAHAARQYYGHVTFQIVDAVSIEGFLLSFRYGIRKYPAVIIDHEKIQPKLSLEELDDLIKMRLASNV